MIRAASPKKRSRIRGATLPEYALLLFAVLLIGAGAYRTLGAKVDTNARLAATVLTSGGSGGGIGGGMPGLAAGSSSAPGWASAIGGWVRDFGKGLILGDFAEGGNVWARTAGQIVGGFIPIVGQIGDIRDLAAAVRDVAQGREGGWTNLAMAGVAVVPGVGDAAKGIFKEGRAVRTAVKDADEIAIAIKDGRRVAKEGEEIGGAIAGTTRKTEEAAKAAEEAKRAEQAAKAEEEAAAAAKRAEKEAAEEAAQRAAEIARGDALYRDVLKKIPANSPEAKELRKMIDEGKVKIRVVDPDSAHLGTFQPPKPGEVAEITISYEGRSGPAQRQMAESMYHETKHVQQWEKLGKPNADEFYEYYKQNYHWMETEAELAGRTMNREVTPEAIEAAKKFVKDGYADKPDFAKINDDYWRSTTIKP